MIKFGAVPVVLKVCRICLATDMKMFNIGQDKLFKAYEQITGLLIQEDRLPQTVCWECAQRLNTSYDLRNKALTANEIMLKTLQNTSILSISDIKKLDRTACKLKSSLTCMYYESDYCDMQIRDSQIFVKTESENESKNILDDTKVDEELLNIERPFLDVDNLKIESVIVNMDCESDEYENPYLIKDNVLDNTDSNQFTIEVKREKSNPNTTIHNPDIQDSGGKKSKSRKKQKKSSKKQKTEDKKGRQLKDIDVKYFTRKKLTYEQQIEEVNRRKDSPNYIEALYRCEKCYRGFASQEKYDIHMKKHSELSGAFECLICKTRMKSNYALKKHLRSLHSHRFSCKQCSFQTNNRTTALAHIKWHSGAKFACSQCPSVFGHRTSLFSHMRIKHVSEFICELCGYNFMNKLGIYQHKKRVHLRTYTEAELVGPYCELCDVKFLNEAAHSIHFKLCSKHSKDEEISVVRNLPRGERLRLYKSERDKKLGQSDKSERERRPRKPAEPISCELCGMECRSLMHYASHFRHNHPGEKRTQHPPKHALVMCEQCGNTFQSLCHLNYHMSVHSDEKRYECSHCGKRFSRKENLVSHMRTHDAGSGRRTYDCPECGKQFSFQNNMQRHVLIHKGLKPFKCEYCGKGFKTGEEVRNHVKHVHLKQPWPKRVRARTKEHNYNDGTIEDTSI